MIIEVSIDDVKSGLKKELAGLEELQQALEDKKSLSFYLDGYIAYQKKQAKLDKELFENITSDNFEHALSK